MPEYVKLPKSGGEVRKVIKWDLKEDCAAALTGNYWCYTPFISPATVEEYEQYLKTKQQ